MTFECLVDGWLKSLRLTPEDIALEHGKGYQEPDTLEDPVLIEEWISYHEFHAVLRCVCRECNQSRLRKAVPGRNLNPEKENSNDQ